MIYIYIYIYLEVVCSVCYTSCVRKADITGNPRSHGELTYFIFEISRPPTSSSCVAEVPFPVDRFLSDDELGLYMISSSTAASHLAMQTG